MITTHLKQVPRLRMRGTLPPMCTQRQHYLRSSFKILVTLFYDMMKKSNNIPGEEQVLLLVTQFHEQNGVLIYTYAV
jgi:hypothetical protein